MTEVKKVYEALNKAQEQAVDHDKGPLMVVAGAGTGKTRVIVDRILKLIDNGVAPENILALTFTEKAASQMLDRLNELRGGYTFDTTIMTYNAFGGEILSRFASEIGLSNNQKLLGETGQLVFLRDNIDELGLDYYAPVSSLETHLENLARYFSSLKQQIVLPKKYKEFSLALPKITDEEKLESQKHQELASAYGTYISLCRSRSVIDFDDQIFLTLELLKSRPNIKKRLTETYKYILVDEYQDTNPMQSALLDELSGTKNNIMVVGDDDQSIYGWRGATLANILQFKERYPKSKEVTLIENYRSTQPILDAAYKLIQNNNPNRLESIRDLDKKLKSQQKGGREPKTIRFATLESELAWIARDIQTRIKQGALAGSIAVMARRNAIVSKIHQSLETFDIDHVVAGLSSDMYHQTTVSSLIEALKAIADPNDNTALYHTLGGPLFGIDPHLLAEATSEAKAAHNKLSDVLMASKDEEVATALEMIVDWRSRTPERNVGQLAYEIISESGWKDALYVRAKEDIETSLQVQALSQFFTTLKEFENVSDVPSTLSYLDNLETLKAAGSELRDDSLELDGDSVSVLTIHKAKGLEWEVVYIVDCTEGSLPMRRLTSAIEIPEALAIQSMADDHMAEERRLMYVATTRAEKDLILTHSDTHTGSTKRRPSRFLEELFGDGLEVDDQTSSDKQLGLELFASTGPVKKISPPSKMIRSKKIQLTATQVGDYLRCPLDFYYRHILGVPQPPGTARPYGTVIHSVIQTILEGRKRNKLPSLDDILDEAEDKWPTTGYTSAKQRKRAHDQGQATIKKIYKRMIHEDLPTEIEMPFKVVVPESDLILTGRIDAVYTTKQGTEIRDFKTGTTVDSAEKAKRRAQSSVQLSLYALAWRTLKGELPARLVLDFVETDQIGDVRKRRQSIDTLQTKLGDLPIKVKAGDYPPLGDHKFCRHPI